MPRQSVKTMESRGIRGFDAAELVKGRKRQIILREPVPKIGRKQKSLVPLAVDNFAMTRF